MVRLSETRCAATAMGSFRLNSCYDLLPTCEQVMSLLPQLSKIEGIHLR